MVERGRLTEIAAPHPDARVRKRFGLYRRAHAYAKFGWRREPLQFTDHVGAEPPGRSRDDHFAIILLHGTSLWLRRPCRRDGASKRSATIRHQAHGPFGKADQCRERRVGGMWSATKLPRG